MTIHGQLCKEEVQGIAQRKCTALVACRLTHRELKGSFLYCGRGVDLYFNWLACCFQYSSLDMPKDPRQVTSYVDLDAPAEGDSEMSFL